MKLFTVILFLLFSVTSCINKPKPLYLTGIQWMSLEIDFVSNKDYNNEKIRSVVSVVCFP